MGQLLQRDWPRAGGGVLRLDRLLVDMGYKSGLVAAVKHKVGGTTMMLSKGVGIKAGGRPVAMYQRKPGWQLGHNWFIPSVTGPQEFPHVCVDMNYWKGFVHDRLAVAPGDPRALTLFGKTAALQRRLHPPDLGRPDHAAARMSALREADDDLGDGGLTRTCLPIQT